ncbi:MAG: zinc-binding dehydrogenase [Acidimicrobiia bacterium]|nr:zinc-binding dehydrogenase [Acidimicrobiia bacterium]
MSPPVVGRTFPLAEAAEAIAYVGRRHGAGKTVISP